MQQRKLLAIAAGLALLCGLGVRASAQNEAPFSIRYPPDGATVREVVPIRVPLASIPDKGYVSFSIDGVFRVALSLSDAQRDDERKAAARAHRPPMFTYIWNTKAPMKVKGSSKEAPPADGEHEIAATLHGSDSHVQQTSSVRVNVANKIAGNPGPLSLRYRYVDGANLTYLRDGQTSIVSGLSQGMGGSEDQEMVAMNGQLLYAVEDRYANGHAIVRNKLKTLNVRQNGQETSYPDNLLPQSLYQEVDPLGHVHYQNETISFDQFAQLGVPVSTTLALPVLPSSPKLIGDKWTTPNVPLDIPGTAPDKQPRVAVENTLAGLEWEGGYQTARIHQHYDSANGGLKDKSVVFGTFLIDTPRIQFDRDIYIAYRSGTLVKMDGTLEVSGKTGGSVTMGAGMPGGAMGGIPGGPMGAMPPGAMGGPMGPMGPMGAMGGAMPPGAMPPGAMYGGGRGGRTGAGFMAPPGMIGGPGMMGRRGMGMQGTGRTGRRGMGFPGAPGGYAGASGMPGGGVYGGRGGYMGGMAGGTGQQSNQITLKSTTSTALNTPQARLAAGR